MHRGDAATALRRLDEHRRLFQTGDFEEDRELLAIEALLCATQSFSASSCRFFVVLSGRIEVVQPAGGAETRIVVHGPGQFTGEINMISARRSLLRARTTVASELLVVDNSVLRTLVQRDAELSEISCALSS